MEKLFAGLTIIVVVLGVSCGFLLYQVVERQIQSSDLKTQTTQLENQIDELENQINELESQTDILETLLEEQKYQQKLADAKQVKITKIESGEWINHWIIASHQVYVTVTNQGANNVDGLTVVAEYTSGGTNEEPLGLLKAGQSKTVTFGEESGPSGRSTISGYIIRLGDEIVYEH